MSMGGGGIDVDIPTGKMNNLLDTGLNNALQYSQGYTNRAVGAQENYYQQALNQLLQGQNALQGGFDQSQALQAPYRDAGYQSLDSYMDTLMLARPEMGSKTLADSLTKEAKTQQMRQNLAIGNLALNSMFDPSGNPHYANTPQQEYDIYGKPTKPTVDLLARANNPAEQMAYMSQFFVPNNKNGGYTYTGYGPGVTSRIPGGTAEPGPWNMQSPSEMVGWYKPGSSPEHGGYWQLAQAELPGAMGLYNQNLLNYNRLNEFLQNQYTPNQQKISMAYNQGLFTTPKVIQV